MYYRVHYSPVCTIWTVLTALFRMCSCQFWVYSARYRSKSLTQYRAWTSVQYTKYMYGYSIYCTARLKKQRQRGRLFDKYVSDLVSGQVQSKSVTNSWIEFDKAIHVLTNSVIFRTQSAIVGTNPFKHIGLHS